MVRLFLRPVAALLAFGLAAHAQSAPPATELRDMLPMDGRAEQVVLIEPGKRTWYLGREGTLAVYDHATRRSTPVAAGPVWDATVSAKRDLVAYVKGGPERADHHVWVLAIDPQTAQPRGAERRLSPSLGDTPAISPDGKLVAFARDDATGLGQSLVIVPVMGGEERVVAPEMPSSLRAIAWAPDSKTIYFSVNPPVACVPEWSCLPLGEARRQWGTVRRAAIGGRAISTLAPRVRSGHPGLSPDGTTLVYSAVDGTRRWIVADPDGVERTSFSLPSGQAIHGWTGGSTLLLTSGRSIGPITSLLTIDLASTRRP